MPVDQLTILASRCPKMAQLIQDHGPLGYEPKSVNFDSFARSIIGQQVSVAAARSIYNKVLGGLGLEGEMNPEAFIGHTPESLREVGLSRQKAGYLLDLAEKARNKQIHFSKFDQMGDQAIVDELIAVKGIGEWTIQMVLMFSLGRPDVMPAGDLGIQEGLRRLDGMQERPKPKQIIERAAVWAPVRSYASLYLWKLKDTPNVG